MICRFSKYVFSKISKNQLSQKSYQEIVDLVVKKYGNRQLKHPNSACLYQIQHHHKIISPGDYVLDIGAGPDFRWTQLALTYAQNEQRTHKVISNDKISFNNRYANNRYIQGNFLEEQIRTNIGLQAQNKQFDTILVDVSPQFTGNIHDDGQKINNVIHQALIFSSLFLKKGGNFVCKVLNCDTQLAVQKSVQIAFHQFYNFKPSVIRNTSPVHFFILKGFGMNFQMEAVDQFFTKYKGSYKNKTEIVKMYQNKYRWNPIQLIIKKAKRDIFTMKRQGRSDYDIEKLYMNDPFVNFKDIMKKTNMVLKAQNSADKVQFEKAMNKFTDGQMYSRSNEIPNTREQWINFLQKSIKQLKGEKKQKQKKKQQNLQPLGEHEVYMKQYSMDKNHKQTQIYMQQDLTGLYQEITQKQYIQRQLLKIKSIMPQKAQFIDDLLNDGNKKKIDFVEQFGWQQKKNLSEQLQDLQANIKLFSQQQFKQKMDSDGYEKQINNIIQNRNKAKNNRQKYRNK